MLAVTFSATTGSHALQSTAQVVHAPDAPAAEPLPLLRRYRLGVSACTTVV